MAGSIKRLFECFFVWKISDTKPNEVTTNRPDCIIMQAFGQREDPVSLGAGGLYTSRIVPGVPNEEIARVLTRSDMRRNYPEGLPPVLAQWEFTETRVATSSELNIEFPLGSRSRYRNTRDILVEAKDLMDQHRWTKAVIVAHPWHLVRCVWIAQNLGIEIVHDQQITQLLNDYAALWNSGVQVPENQKQTTSLVRWLWYEIRARIYFWLKGWI